MPHVDGGKIGYQPALDGLRAVAVGGVIAYHLGVGWAPGGFLGVDTFFVLSGYLITTLLLVERAGSGRIDFRAFWARRARRLLPALFLVLTAVALWAALTLPADQLGNIRSDGLATLFYGANWRFISSGQSYFAMLSLPSPLRHAWSLAIEEQFYLVWPLLAAACLRLGRGRPRVLGAVCIAGSIASATAMALLYNPIDSSRAYYGTDTRAQALLIGALLAVVLRRWSARADAGTAGAAAPPAAGARAMAHLRSGAGVAAACACLAAFGFVGDASGAMYHGGFALFAVAVALLIATTVVPGPSVVRRVLSLRPIVWVGTISYGLYLWHWPVQVALTPPRTGIDGAGLDVLRVAATVALATLSYYLVEQPIRRGALARRWRQVLTPLVAVGVGGVLLASTAGAVPPPAYLRNEGSAGIDRALAGIRGRRAGASPDATTPTTTTLTTTSSTTTPSTTGPSSTAPPATTTFAPHRLLAVGDSVLASLVPALEPAAVARGLHFDSAAIPGCGVFTGEPLGPNQLRLSWTARCGSGMAHFQLTAVQETRPDLIVWLSTWETADRIVDGNVVQLTTPEGIAMTNRLLDETVSRLTSTGAKIAFLTIAPTTWSPDYGAPTPDATRRVELLNDILLNYAYAHPDRAFVVPLDQQVCPTGPPCPGVVDGVQLRNRDGRHYSSAGAAWLTPWLLDQLATPRVMPAAP